MLWKRSGRGPPPSLMRAGASTATGYTASWGGVRKSGGPRSLGAALSVAFQDGAQVRRRGCCWMDEGTVEAFPAPFASATATLARTIPIQYSQCWNMEAAPEVAA